jgi:signal transduction histidine kinase
VKLSSPEAAGSFSDGDLELRRQQIRKGLRKANTAGAVILIIVIGLSLAALAQALRAERNAHTAERATSRAQEELWKAQLAQARALRLSGVAGRKSAAMEAITSAAAIRRNGDLRNEAIAALALTDVSESGTWHPARVFGREALAFSRDLNMYALGNPEGVVTLFRMDTGAKIAQFQGPRGGVGGIKFSPDGRLLAAFFNNGEVTLWRVSDAVCVSKWNSGKKSSRVGSIDFSPDSRELAIAGDETQVCILEVENQNEVRSISVAAPVRSAVFSPDGKMLGLAISNSVQLWRCPELTFAQALSHAGEVETFGWHPDSRRLASTSRGTSEILLWDTVTGKSRTLRGHAELVPNLVFDRRADLLVSYSWDGSTRFWQASDGELLFVSRAGFGMAFDATDRMLAYAREQQGFGLWKIDRSPVYRELTLGIGASPYITGFDFSPNGRGVAVVNPAEGLHLLDVANGNESSFSPAENLLSVWFGNDNQAVTISRHDISYWRFPGHAEKRWETESRVEAPAGLTLDFGTVTRGSSSLIAIPTWDSVFWADLANPSALHRLNGRGSMGPLNCAAISADTSWIATTYWKGGGTAIWDTRTEQKIHDLGRNGGYVAFSPDNRWLLVGSAHKYSVWDTSNWRVSFEFNRETTGELVGTGAFSPDSKLLAICPEVNVMQLIRVPEGHVLANLSAPNLKNIGRVAFNQDGTVLAGSTFDGRLQLWNFPALKKELAALNLDWDSSEEEPPVLIGSTGANDQPTANSTGRAYVMGQTIFYWLDGLGVLAAMFIGLYTLRYHQKMVRSYEAVETMVAQRNRELKMAQVELMHSQKMKAMGTLAAGIAHDFNNLLSVIRMGNQLQRRDDISGEDRAESGLAVERAVEQGKKVVRSMLGYSHEPAGGREVFSVPELVDEVVLLLNKQFLGGLTLMLELNRDTPAVAGIRGRLEQILLNLVVNAAEAMNGKGRLMIGVREITDINRNGTLLLRPKPATHYVELVVGDNGTGIESGIQERIFEPFFSTKAQSSSSGTGLGLSLVHSLAEQEGIGIGLSSETGKGSTFTILIPVEQNALRTEAPTRSATASS